MVHNAIDWLTRRWNHSALHDKPLAIIGATDDGYSGVWSRHQTEESRRIAGTRIIEPITVTTLHEAVTKLAEQANIITVVGTAAAASRYAKLAGDTARKRSIHTKFLKDGSFFT